MKIKDIRWCGFKLLRVTYFIYRGYILVSRVLHIRSWAGPTISFYEYSLISYHIRLVIYDWGAAVFKSTWSYHYKVVQLQSRSSTRSYHSLQHGACSVTETKKMIDRRNHYGSHLKSMRLYGRVLTFEKIDIRIAVMVNKFVDWMLKYFHPIIISCHFILS